MITVFGTICLDRIRKVKAMPPLGGYAPVLEEAEFVGGEAANTAAALIKWGHEAALFGTTLGADDASRRLRRLAKNLSLSLSNVTDSSEAVTPVCDIYVTDEGERTMFGVGFDVMDRFASIEGLEYERGAWFTAEPEMPEASLKAALKAQAAGMKLYLMDFDLSRLPLRPGDWWQSSTDQFGSRGTGEEVLDWVKEFASEHPCGVILTDGPNGFAACWPGSAPRFYPPFPAPMAIDMTGAGDVFRAGMLHGLEQDWKIPDCLRFASAAASLSAGILGGSECAPSIEAVQAHILRHPDVSRYYE